MRLKGRSVFPAEREEQWEMVRGNWREKLPEEFGYYCGSSGGGGNH